MKWVEVPVEHALGHFAAHTDPEYRVRVDGQVRSLKIIDTASDNTRVYIAARLNRRLKTGYRWISNHGRTHERLEIPEKYVCSTCLTD